MAERFNVAQRLADGAAAVEHTQSYVWACHILGYQHPDLTAYAAQVRDWYDTEDGLDLRVLDADCAKLRAAANAADEALSRQRAQHAELAEAWTGAGAGAATEFLQRHCRAAEAVAANVRAAAERCAELRDDLWQLIDAKAATAIAIDDRRLAERPAWLAAALAVSTGAVDRSAADELVDHQVKPYVDNDIRSDWLDAMRSTAVSVDASLDAATDAVSAATVPRFEVPGDLVAQSSPLDEPPAPNVGGPVPVVPASAVPPPAGRPPAGLPPAGLPPAGLPPAGADAEVPAAPPAAPDAAPPPLPTGDPLGSALGGLDGLGGASGASGLSGLGSSIGGIISQIVDAVGGLLGSSGNGLDGPDDQFDPDDEPEPQPDADSDIDTEPAEADDNGEPAAPETPEIPPAPATPVEEPASSPAADASPGPTAEPAPPNAEPAPPEPEPPTGPPADSEPDKHTPCEIAADELPQAGQ